MNKFVKVKIIDDIYSHGGYVAYGIEYKSDNDEHYSVCVEIDDMIWTYLQGQYSLISVSTYEAAFAEEKTTQETPKNINQFFTQELQDLQITFK